MDCFQPAAVETVGRQSILLGGSEDETEFHQFIERGLNLGGHGCDALSQEPPACDSDQTVAGSWVGFEVTEDLSGQSRRR